MSDSEVVVIATVQVLPGHAEELIERFGEVIDGTHSEEGCLTYALNQDSVDENRFAVVERWRSQADLDAHFEQPHMAVMAGLANSLAAPPEVMFCRPLPRGLAEKNFGGAN